MNSLSMKSESSNKMFLNESQFSNKPMAKPYFDVRMMAPGHIPSNFNYNRINKNT